MSANFRRALTTLAPAALVVAATAIGVLIAEAVLRLAVDPNDFRHATVIDDPILGHRIPPLHAGHDALGFRNRETPGQVDIVAIGDSNTYGVSAPRVGSWPYQLGRQLGKPVYNMGLGGYGPLQYVHLARESARQLQPRLLIVGLYFGNDLLDAFYLAQTRPHWYAWRQSKPDVPVADVRWVSDPPKKRFEFLRDWLARHSALYWVARATVSPLLPSPAREALATQPRDGHWPWADPARVDLRTIFTPRERLAAMDLDLPNVREGMQITLRAIAELQDESGKQGSRTLIVMIPSKERVYCNYLKATDAAMPDDFARLCDAEARIKAHLVRFMEARRLAYVDPTDALERKVQQHVTLYPEDADSHPVAAGYGVIAGAVASAIRSLALTQ